MRNNGAQVHGQQLIPVGSEVYVCAEVLMESTSCAPQSFCFSLFAMRDAARAEANLVRGEQHLLLLPGTGHPGRYPYQLPLGAANFCYFEALGALLYALVLDDNFQNYFENNLTGGLLPAALVYMRRQTCHHHRFAALMLYFMVKGHDVFGVYIC